MDREELLKRRDNIINDERLKENRVAYVHEHAMNNVRIAAIDNNILRCEIEINYLMDSP
jgi:hypothetical protein